MLDYESLFTSEAVIRVLCKQRMAFCRDAHTRGYFEKLLPSDHQEPPNKFNLRLMPPRSRRKRVSNKTNSHLQNTNNLKFTVDQLRKASSSEDKIWIHAQEELIQLIQTKALANNVISLDQPKITPIPKEGQTKTPT
jgi:hypothetical protein